MNRLRYRTLSTQFSYVIKILRDFQSHFKFHCYDGGNAERIKTTKIEQQSRL